MANNLILVSTRAGKSWIGRSAKKVAVIFGDNDGVATNVGRHTASAAEMITIFAKENKLATTGRTDGGPASVCNSVKVVHGYCLVCDEASVRPCAIPLDVE